jgi:hypothetical protein
LTCFYFAVLVTKTKLELIKISNLTKNGGTKYSTEVLKIGFMIITAKFTKKIEYAKIII